MVVVSDAIMVERPGEATGEGVLVWEDRSPLAGLQAATTVVEV